MSNRREERRFTRERKEAAILSGLDYPEFDDFGEDDEEDDYDPGEECGRWSNGRLGHHCSLAGSEWCDWECPYSR